MTTGDSTNPGKTVGKVSELTVIFPIKEGMSDQFRQMLNEGQPHFEQLFERVRTVHNARWVFLPGGTHALLATVFDGAWDQYIDDFATHAGPLLDALGALVEGWPGAGSGQALQGYIRSIQVPAEIFFCAYPDASVRDVQRGLQVNSAFQQLLDASQA